MKKYLGTILTIIFFAVFIGYFIKNPDIIKPLGEISILLILGIAALRLFTIYLNGIFTQIILFYFEKKVSSIETFYLSLLSAIGNYFTPMQGGSGIRAVYLKKKHGLAYSHFISTLSGNYIIAFLINSFIGLLSLVIIQIKQNEYSILLYTLFGTIFLVTLLLIIFEIPESINKIDSKYRILKRIINILTGIISGWNRITRNRKLLTQLVIITVLNFAASLLITYLEFFALDVKANIWSLSLYTSISSLAILLSLTPGAIGIREAIFIFAAAILGITNDQILQIAVIDRGILYVVLLISYLIFKISDKAFKGFLSKNFK